MDAVFNIHKPAGMTSNDVVAVMRKILNMKKIGHGGTLDPDATGVLPVFTGTATRLLEFAVAGRKEYVAEFTLGQQRETGDSSGQIISEAAVPEFSREQIEAVFRTFLGKQLQTPPMYSALKVHGQKLYQLARKGQEVPREPREIAIYNLELLTWQHPVLKVRVECSKGTYIRVLGEDLARKLGTLGYMSSLVRTRVADFRLENAYTLEQIRENPLACAATPLSAVQLPKLQLTPMQAYRLTSGVATTVRNTQDGRYALIGPQQEFLGVAMCNGEILKAEKVLTAYANPQPVGTTE